MDDVIVTAYIKNDSKECERVIHLLSKIKDLKPHQKIIINIDEDPAYKNKFFDSVPYLQIGPYQLRSPITREKILISLNAARDRLKQLKKINDPVYVQKEKKSKTYSRADRISFWLTRHYMLLINFLLFLYVGLPFLAPILMKLSLERPARVIYAVYRPLCHQFAFRSWFLFGEQPVYPRDLANLDYPITYEDIVGHEAIDPLEARMIIGNDKLGYKVALCQRDVAIWGSFLVTGITFSIFRRKIHPIPWYLWLVVGVLPIALDGGTQFLNLALPALDLFLIRESTPLSRTITGAIFGILTGWYLFPLIEESMVDTEQILDRKHRITERFKSPGH